MILITGTTGLVGTHLLANLLEKTEAKAIRGLYRSQEKKSHCLQVIQRVYGKEIESRASQIEWQLVDITNIPLLENSFQGIEYVYHCAGIVSNSPSKHKLLRKINIEGTANVVNLAIDHDVKRLCHVSSIATLGKNEKNQPIDEDAYRENLNNSSHYSISKYGGEMEVWRASQEGLDVTIVNPGVILGEGFYTEGSGELFRQIAKKFPFKIHKKTGFVGVKDVVQLMVLCMDSKLKNNRFILVAENLMLSDVQNSIAQYLQTKPPRFQLKKWMLYVYWIIEMIGALFTKKERKISLDIIPTILDDATYSNEKTKEKFSYTFTPIHDVIMDCCKDFKQYPI